MSEYHLINDAHLSDKAPASCTDTYLDDLFDLLAQVSRRAGDRDGTVILAGDVFHHKTPGRTSHSTVMRLIEWARNSGCPIYAVVGNHDMAHDRRDSINETQPLGVVFKSDAIRPLDGWIETFGPVYGVPWQMTWDKANVEDALADYRRRVTDTKVRPWSSSLVVTHAPLYPPGRELKYEFFPAQTWAEAMDHHGTVHYGHVHEPHGIYQVDGVVFSNPGALSRGSLHEHNLNRTPGYAVWDSDTGEIRHETLAAKPASEVFRLHDATEAKAAGVNLNRFLDSIKATRLDISSTASVLDHVRTTQDDPALVAVIEKLMESV